MEFFVVCSWFLTLVSWIFSGVLFILILNTFCVGLSLLFHGFFIFFFACIKVFCTSSRITLTLKPWIVHTVLCQTLLSSENLGLSQNKKNKEFPPGLPMRDWQTLDPKIPNTDKYLKQYSILVWYTAAFQNINYRYVMKTRRRCVTKQSELPMGENIWA
jgi:hypothetical protein